MVGTWITLFVENLAFFISTCDFSITTSNDCWMWWRWNSVACRWTSVAGWVDRFLKRAKVHRLLRMPRETIILWFNCGIVRRGRWPPFSCLYCHKNALDIRWIYKRIVTLIRVLLTLPGDTMCIRNGMLQVNESVTKQTIRLPNDTEDNSIEKYRDRLKISFV